MPNILLGTAKKVHTLIKPNKQAQNKFEFIKIKRNISLQKSKYKIYTHLKNFRKPKEYFYKNLNAY